MERKQNPTPAEVVLNKVNDLTRKVGLLRLQAHQFFEDKIQPDFNRKDEAVRLGKMYADAERVASDATWLEAMIASNITPETVLEVSERVDEMRRSNREQRNGEY